LPTAGFLLHAAEIALEAEQEMQRHRHRDVIGERGTGEEKDRRGDQKRQQRRLLAAIEARRNELPELIGDHRESEHQRGEERDFDLDEKSLANPGEDDPRLTGVAQRLDQKGEDRPGEVEADAEGGEQGDQRPQQAPPQLDEMVEQRRPAVVDVLHSTEPSSNSEPRRNRRPGSADGSASGPISSGGRAEGSARGAGASGPSSIGAGACGRARASSIGSVS